MRGVFAIPNSDYTATDPFLIQFIERQRRFLLAVIGEQANRTRMLELIRSNREFFIGHEFGKDKDFIRAEAILVADMEIDRDDLKTMLSLADKNKQSLFDMISAPPFNVNIRDIVASDRLNWSGLGQGLLGINTLALTLPEPLVTKSVGLTSAFIRLALCAVSSSYSPF